MAQNHQFHRVIPWSTEEYLWINGTKLVYTARPDGEVRVHFPGGYSKLLSSIDSKYNTIALPSRWRKEGI